MESLFHQAGVIWAGPLQEMFDVAAGLLVPELSGDVEAALLAELDLNPVFVRQHGAVAADVRVRFGGQAAP